MSTKYKITEIEKAYFITITTVGWVDIFTRLNQKYVIINTLKHCQENKGLVIFSYCLMHSHLHLFCRFHIFISRNNEGLQKIYLKEDCTNYIRRA